MRPTDPRTHRTTVKLSVVIPIYNEAATIERIVDKVQSVEIEKELILIVTQQYPGTAMLKITVEMKKIPTLKAKATKASHAIAAKIGNKAPQINAILKQIEP